MKTTHSLCLAVILAAAGALFAGCESNDAPVGADIGGDWTGEYNRPGFRESISARIEQNGRDLVIDTTHEGEAHTFIGKINGDGRIMAEDVSTGETWTSLGDITSNRVFLRDFLLPLGTGGEQEIILNR